MNENEKQDQAKSKLGFESLEILIGRWKDGTFGEIIEDWKWIFSYSKKYKGAIAFYTILGILSTSLALIGSVIGKYIVDIITGYETDRLVYLIIMMVGSALLSLLLENVIHRISTGLSVDINNDIQADVFDKIMDADWMAINQFSYGDILNRYNGDVRTISSNAISWLPTIIIAMYNFIATFVVILHYDKMMALIAFAAAPFTILMSRFIVRKQREYNKQVRAITSDMTTFEIEAFYNMDTIKSFGIAEHYSNKMKLWHKKFKKLTMEANWFSIKTSVYRSVIGLFVQYAAFGYCLYRLWTGGITYGTMILFLQQRNSLTNALNQVISIIPAFLNSSVSAGRIRELAVLPKEKHIKESCTMDVRKDDGFEVRMEGVDFAYMEDKKVITDSHFIAKPGEIVALIGPSGEGKTTMIRLILGLVHPESGHAMLKDSDGKAVEMNVDLRHLFAYVPQGNTILQGTIAENLRMVKEDATEEEMTDALKTACAWDFIAQLPDGINSRVGERGKGFSEGQAQRIAIARAILRNAPILLLDEATSALDVTTERNVLRNIVKQHPNKTCIVTTHRPSVLNLCQRVYRVVETRVTEMSEEESCKMVMDF